MRFADALLTRQSRIEVRAEDIESQEFAKALPADLARATILDATSVYEYLLPESVSRLAKVPSLAVVPSWHISFVEMCTNRAFGLHAGVLLLRGEDKILASLVLGNPFKSMRVANFYTRFDPITGVLVGETSVALPVHLQGKSQAFSAAFAAALYAFAFANCKNVNVTESVGPRAQRKRFESIHGHKPLRYYVLDISPLRRLAKDATEPGTEVQRALHICRGHFRTYTEQRKLFGKVAGTFWVEEHARGAVENGLVVKDYSIPEMVCAR